MEVSEALGSVMATAIAVTTVTTLSLSCILKLSVKRLLNSFKNLQIVVHIMLIDLFSVAQCEILIGEVMKMSNL